MDGLMTLDRELQTCSGVRKEDVEAIMEWMQKQPHLPQMRDNAVIEGVVAVSIAVAIKRRYNSVERAKENLDNYLTFRTLAPEISIDRTLKNKRVQKALATSYTAMMDERDAEGNIVCFWHLHDPDVNNYNFTDMVHTVLMILESWFHENGSTGAPGLTLVFDQKNLTLGHVAKMSLSTTKKINFYAKECAVISTKNIHVLNASNMTSTLLAFFKPLLSNDLFQKIRTFTPSQIDEFYKYVPLKAVPNEYGGVAGSLQDLQNKDVKRLERMEPLFEMLDALKVDESKRIGPQKNENNLFGLEGTFRKLNVD